MFQVIKKLFFITVAFGLGLVLAGCGGAKQATIGGKPAATEITVSAAMSLKDALEEIKSIYTGQHTGVIINLNLASSGTLRKQIEEGAPVDLFISADVKHMDELAGKGLFDQDGRVNLLGNELVLVTKKDNNIIKDFRDLAGSAVINIAIGVPETVPAGEYAKEALVNMGLWDKVQPKLVPANDVRHVLTYVETGNTDVGFVYRSDVLAGKNVKIALTVPYSLYKPIIYPAVVMQNAREKESARYFLNYLSGPEAQAVFKKCGFKVLVK